MAATTSLTMSTTTLTSHQPSTNHQSASLTPNSIRPYLAKLNLPQADSHKGQNGKLLIIGGSKLFHAASKWSLDVASRFVDMVFYSSIPSNNQLIQEAKKNFWNGIVIPRQEIKNYLHEADAVLIGPGMERQEQTTNRDWSQPPTSAEWQNDTEKIINYLLSKYPDKKWVIDAGALQMVDPQLLNKNCLLTPHEKELVRLINHLPDRQKVDFTIKNLTNSSKQLKQLQAKLLPLLNQPTLLLKGPIDYVVNQHTIVPIKGGNAGMTKGGTGDVLAGLAAALYCTNDALTSAVVGSYLNKKAGDHLYQQVGPFFNASDLVDVVGAG
ncbi:MAG: NAD(P)H-hydrate dehydratase [Candidatus Pacebacteria bacterium]|nr:NAD(P)H-hydrate dehydratase [Candidatus Paceibacterota bacterium]